MNEHVEKKLIALVSRSLRQYGVRAVRMDVIAREMNMSKRTLYKVYKTKDNLLNICLEAYADRMRNLFQIIRCNHPEPLAFWRELSKAFVENLYKAESVFWCEVARCYRYIYDAIQNVWFGEMERVLLACQTERLVLPDLDVRKFLASFTTMLYQARVTECPSEMLHDSAYYMLRGVLTGPGLIRLGQCSVHDSSIIHHQ